MTKQIFINCTSSETRLALVEDTVLQQIYIDRGEGFSLVGNIVKARVLRVMPGMQAAFLDIGAERSAFLHIDDIHQARANDKIADILRSGQDLLVQVVKDPINQKGALLTTDLSIATKFLVYRHGRKKLAISSQIKQKKERDRLNKLFESIVSTVELPENLTGNFILRSAAEDINTSELRSDISNLIKIWCDINYLRVKKSPVNLYREEAGFYPKVAEMLDLGIDKITVDSSELLDKLTNDYQQKSNYKKQIVELYSDKNLFEHYQIEAQINAALDLNVSLACGGFLVVEETEALSVIDVNTGSYVGNCHDQQTFLEVNLEAAIESVRQIRLRNLTGIIIIDFIDMQASEHRRLVLKQLKKAFLDDTTKTIISDFTDFGLIQIARKKTSQSLSQILCKPCNHCDAKGLIKSEETISYEILRALVKVGSNGAHQCLEVYASAIVIEQLNNKFTAQLNQFTSSAECDVKLCIESSIPNDQFNIIPA